MNFSSNFLSLYIMPIKSVCGWNITGSGGRDHEIRYLDMVTYPVFLMLCTVGNAVNIAILARERPVSPRKVYLLGIAIADLIYMWSALFPYIMTYDAEIYGGSPRASIKQDVARISGVVHFLQETSAIVSSWLIVAFTVQRFVAIKYPLRHLISGVDARCSIYVVLAIGLTAGAWSSHRLVDYYNWFCNYNPPKPPPPRSLHMLRWNQTYSWSLVIIQISTFLIILILNAVLFRVITAQQQHQRRELQASLKAHAAAGPRPERAAMVLLNACVILYLITQWPVCLANILRILEKACVQQMNDEVKSILLHMSCILLNVNFSTNFLVYCGADRRFRARLCTCTGGGARGSYLHPRLSERTIVLSATHSPHELHRLMGRQGSLSNSSSGQADRGRGGVLLKKTPSPTLSHTCLAGNEFNLESYDHSPHLHRDSRVPSSS